MVNVLVPGLYVSGLLKKKIAHVLLHVEPHLLGQSMIVQGISASGHILFKRCPLVALDLLGLYQNQMSDEFGH